MTTTDINTQQTWRRAAIGGGIVVVLLAIFGTGFGAAIFVGLVIGAIGGFLLPSMAAAQTKSASVTLRAAASAKEALETAPAAEPQAPSPKPVKSVLAMGSIVRACKVLSGQEKRATRTGNWRFENSPSSA